MPSQNFSIPLDVGVGPWSSKNPSSPGWYNASLFRHENILRFWDGRRWSSQCTAVPRFEPPNPVFTAFPRIGPPTPIERNRRIRWRYLNADVVAQAWREASAS